MSPVVLFQDPKLKNSQKYNTVISHLKRLNISFTEMSVDADVDNHKINFFFISSDQLIPFLNQNKQYFKFGFTNSIVLEGPIDPQELNHFRFKHIYLEIPSKEQLQYDIYNSEIVAQKNIKKHIKIYFTGYLLESIIHELNNPLASVMLNCQLIEEVLENKMTFKEGQLEMLMKHNLNAITKSSNITKSVLNYARFDTEDNDLFNVKDNIQQISTFSLPLFRRKQIKLELPQTDLLARMNESDFNLLIVIFFYLFANHMEKGQTLEVKCSGNTLHFVTLTSMEKLSDLYSDLFVPSFYLDLTLQEILANNTIVPEIIDSHLSLKIPKG